MAASLSRYLLLLLLVLSLGLRAAVPAGFMPGQSHWIDFCPHQGWDSGFLDRIATAHADHDQDGEAQLPHCPWSPLVSEYALIDLRTVLSRPSPQASQ
ncbi:hypothetical protein, partial [Amycolatopsis minnesotensis]|uniref:hypothetical protein n=1 Tax=Amycolatopsis minnesotensis TaxID=337894 RepID=UPI0031CF744C